MPCTRDEIAKSRDRAVRYVAAFGLVAPLWIGFAQLPLAHADVPELGCGGKALTSARHCANSQQGQQDGSDAGTSAPPAPWTGGNPLVPVGSTPYVLIPPGMDQAF